MIKFIAGLMIGGLIGVVAMCLFIVAKDKNGES